MSAFPNWQQFAVHQRRQNTGCIPTAYEILLRAAQVNNVDFASFQDDFDLDKNGGEPKNHFVSVAKAIEAKYPDVKFQCESFQKGEGKNKLARVEEFIQKQQPVIVSLANAAFGGKGWHIMVVVDANAENLTLLEYVFADGRIKTKTVSKQQFVDIHDKFAGGDEVAYLVKPTISRPKGDCYKAAYETMLELSELEESGAAKEKGWTLSGAIADLPGQLFF
jgi:hypothetical protein